MIIVSDTSPIANLILIDKLDILRLVFTHVIIPPAVDKEIRALEDFEIDLQKYHSSDWISIKEPSNKLDLIKLKGSLDTGELEAICLAKELKANLLLIDERIGTRKAKEIGLQTIGLIGVLVKAKQENYISNVGSIIRQLRNEGFWISDNLVKIILHRVGEL